MNREITEGNKLIAVFDGWGIEQGMETDPDPYYNRGWNMLLLSEIKYHSKWDWLKPVIDKIFTYAIAYPDQVLPVREMKIVVDIMPAWERVVQFIEWYNSKSLTDAAGTQIKQ